MELLKKLSLKTDSKILLLVFDGLGGLPGPGGKSELETAKKPNLDRMAQAGALGQIDPVRPGVTPGSGPGHLALFGYDPLVFDIGRGILSALGVGFPIEPADIAARVNFCTIDGNGIVTDRRAGRIPTETCVKLCEKLSQIKVSGVEIFVRPEKEHRAALVFRGPGLSGDLKDTDPQSTGKKPLPVSIEDGKDSAETRKTAAIVTEFLDKAAVILKDEHPANMMLTRGFAKFEPIPTFSEIYQLKAAAIATYPMYQGVSRLVGMDILPAGDTPETEVDCLEKHWKDYDFFYLHIKKTDSYGEDGNFDAKVKVIEQVDALIPRMLALKPAIVAVSGDHCTPSTMKAHSYHPVPLLLWGPEVRPDSNSTFGETACGLGGEGRFLSKDLMGLLMGHAGKLAKYGA